jgi:hypothetical protein
MFSMVNGIIVVVEVLGDMSAIIDIYIHIYILPCSILRPGTSCPIDIYKYVRSGFTYNPDDANK